MKTPNKFMQLIVAMILFTSCGNNQSTPEKESTERASDEAEDIQEQDEDIQEVVGTEDWDQILDDYEDFTDKYIAVVKKSAKGDASAATESMELMGKAQELGDKLEVAKDDLTSEQMTRMMAIQAKYLKAAQGVAK